MQASAKNAGSMNPEYLAAARAAKRTHGTVENYESAIKNCREKAKSHPLGDAMPFVLVSEFHLLRGNRTIFCT